MTVWAVIPTCRRVVVPAQTLPVRWVIVHDREMRAVEAPDGASVTHIVAPDPWLYGQGSDSIRSAGFRYAYLNGAPGDVILTVDDDCVLPADWAAQHVEALRHSVPRWSATVPGLWTRGMSRVERPVGLSHGLWDGVPDVSAHDQTDPPQYQRIRVQPGPIAPPFAQSSMNLGFRWEVTPVLYQPAQGPATGMDRYADIWAGVLAQKAMEDRWMCWNGAAVVYHLRASDRQRNLEKEAPGLAVHEDFWRYVWDLAWSVRGPMLGLTLLERYGVLAAHVERFSGGPYFEELGRRMRAWLRAVGH